MNLFSNREIVVMASILGFILLLIIIISILELLDNHKKKTIMNNKDDSLLKEDELKSRKEDVIEEIEILDFDDEVIVKKNDITNITFEEDEITYDIVEPKNDIIEINPIEKTQNDAKEELQKLELELSSDRKIDYEDTITNFELEQEKTAIISYDELVKLGDTLYTENEISQYDDGDEPITIDEVIKRFADSEMVFENTANYEKLNKSVEKETKLVESYKNE